MDVGSRRALTSAAGSRCDVGSKKQALTSSATRGEALTSAAGSRCDVGSRKQMWIVLNVVVRTWRGVDVGSMKALTEGGSPKEKKKNKFRRGRRIAGAAGRQISSRQRGRAISSQDATGRQGDGSPEAGRQGGVKKRRRATSSQDVAGRQGDRSPAGVGGRTIAQGKAAQGKASQARQTLDLSSHPL